MRDGTDSHWDLTDGQPTEARLEAYAMARVVGADLLDSHTIEARLVFWPLSSGWVVVPPVHSDLQMQDVPYQRSVKTEWREIDLDAHGRERLYVWRAHLPLPAWQTLPLRLRLDAIWIQPESTPIETRSVKVPGPWVWEFSMPEGAAPPARPAPRRPAAPSMWERWRAR